MPRSGLCYYAQPWPFALTFLSQAQSQPHDAKIIHASTSATDAALRRPCQPCRRKPQAVAAPQHPRGSCQNLQPPHPGSLIHVPYQLRIDTSTKNVPSKEFRTTVPSPSLLPITASAWYASSKAIITFYIHTRVVSSRINKLPTDTFHLFLIIRTCLIRPSWP